MTRSSPQQVRYLASFGLLLALLLAAVAGCGGASPSGGGDAVTADVAEEARPDAQPTCGSTEPACRDGRVVVCQGGFEILAIDCGAKGLACASGACVGAEPDAIGDAPVDTLDAGSEGLQPPDALPEAEPTEPAPEPLGEVVDGAEPSDPGLADPGTPDPGGADSDSADSGGSEPDLDVTSDPGAPDVLDVADSPGGEPCTGGPCCVDGLWLPEGTPCGSDRDDLPCTDDLCAPDHTCRHVLQPASCLVDGLCRTAGASAPGSPCHACDPARAPLGWSPVDDGSSCDDGDACNGDFACHAGACEPIAAPVTCPEPGRCEQAVACHPVTGACLAEPVPDGTPCGTDDRCDGGAACQGGVCVVLGAAVVCAPPDACHGPGACDGATGLCTYPPLPDGSPCDDGDACNGVSTCLGGACTVTSPPVVCPPAAACRLEGACDPVTGACSYAAVPDGATCDDGDACNGVSTCLAGTCVETTPPVVCAARDACHVAGTCEPASGLCDDPPAVDGTSCDDGDRCNGTADCRGGFCTHATDAVTCAAKDLCHLAGTCDPATGLCSEPERPDGTSCDNGDVCDGEWACQAGSCVLTAAAVECPDPGPCQDAVVCNPFNGLCGVYPGPTGASCDDGDGCNGVSTCQWGFCVQTVPPVTCTPIDACHEAGSCDPSTGRCSSPPVSDGTPCDDGSACNGLSTCVGGACLETTPPLDCTHPGPCAYAGGCDWVAGACVYPPFPDGVDCDDGDRCNGLDACQGGACVQAAPPVDCAPVDACHEVGTCDPATGLCTSPPAPDGTDCDDGDPCNGVSACQDGACVQVAAPVVCQAGDACHEPGVCDPATGLCSEPRAPDGTDCDDGDRCNGLAACLGGACVPAGAPVDCSGLTTSCAAYGCAPATGLCTVLQPLREGQACDDDGLACTTDRCAAGTCAHVVTGAACAIDHACYVHNQDDPARFCRYCNASANRYGWTPKSTATACTDGNACTLTDRCDGKGACAGANPRTCSALDVCHEAGTCDPATGQCSNPPTADGKACASDGAACTLDRCVGGACTHDAPAPDGTACEGDGVACTLDQCRAGTCDHATLAADTCRIAGACVAANTLDPSQCRACRPSLSTTEWSPVDDGAGCPDDGNVCTRDQCKAGVCDHSVPQPDGTACPADPFACTIDRCVSGTCDHQTLVTGTCLIGACYARDALRPGFPCQSCQPDLDPRGWLPVPNGTLCEGGTRCTLNDQCVDGTCVEGPPGSGMACDDGVYCNGADTCLEGACSVHAGTPCTAAQTCNETTDHCMSCTSGPCCTSAGDFAPSFKTCATLPGYFCDCTMSYQIASYYGIQHCSGVSSGCNGAVTAGSWISTFSCGYGPHYCTESGYDANAHLYRSCGCL